MKQKKQENKKNKKKIEIRKINIQKAASFRNYDQGFDFERINIFFGYNGCGKTTISRVLCCLEKKEVIDELKTEDIDEPLFSIETKDKTFFKTNLDNDLKIKVFNQDYINKNINYDNLTGVLITGEENQKKQGEIEKLETEQKNLHGELKSKEEKKESLQREIEELNKKIGNQKSEVAKFIKDRLTGFDNSYDKKKLDDFPKNYSTEFETYKEQSIDLEDEIRNYNLQNKGNIDTLEPLQQITKNEIDTINTILQASVLDSVKISEITAESEKWARDGLELHKDKNECIFCGSPLTEERRKTLNSHFSDEYKNLIEKIDTQIKTLNESNLSKIHEKFDWYDELREKGEKLIEALNDSILEYNKYLDQITEFLERKKNNVFKTDFNVEYKDFNLNISDLNKLINQHRTNHQNFEIRRKASAKKVITYKILEMKKSFNFTENQKTLKTKASEVAEIEKTIGDLDGKISGIEKQIEELSKEIHELHIGADKFNRYLDELLPSLGLKVETNGDNFTLKRNNHGVKHLSEGERNVLSFVYFVLSFSDGKNKQSKLKDDLKDWIVFIDDPISSLDDTNLHLVAGFIKKHFKIAKQLFLTTHNFNFWRCFRNHNGDQGYSHFLIEKNNGSSILFPLDKAHVLVKHNSDYTFIYSKLKQYIKKPHAEDSVTVLNLLRKFLEYFSSFMYPNHSGVDKILETLLHDENKLSPDIEAFVLYSLSNEGSHMQTRTDFISKKPGDISENIQRVFTGMKEKYPEHIDSLDNRV